MPLAARVDAVDAGGHVAKSMPTDANGYYSMVLPVGSYTMRVTSPPAMTTCSSPSVTISSDPIAPVNIACSTPVP